MVDAQLALVAGEPSGDLLASHVLQRLLSLHPQLVCGGIGGPRLRDAGLQCWWPAERLAVNGFAAVLPRLPELLRIRRQLVQRLLQAPPAAYVGVDAPDFNLGVETRLREAGIPTVHFVSPSIWAWRRERIHRIERAVDHLLCVFPFEPELYAGTRVHASYIGHPLAEVIPLRPERDAARQQLGIESAPPVIALLPGSRAGEVEQIGPAFLGAAALLQRRLGCQLLLPVAQPHLRDKLQQQAALHPDLTLHWLDGQSHLAMQACDLALVASGTATLECALFKRPMVIGYRLPRLSWWWMKDKGYLPWVGLPNVLAGETLVPELLQDDCNPQALCAAACDLLDDAARMQRLQLRFDDIHHSLLRPTAQLAAQAIARAAGLD